MQGQRRAGGAEERPYPRGQLRIDWHFCGAADPQAKGAVERLQGYAETNFEPGRRFANPTDFQAQLDGWCDRVNGRVHRTVRAVPAERLFEAFAGRWPELRERTAAPPRTARYDWEDGATRVLVTFTAKGEAKTTVAVSHERIADEETADKLKAMWRERLAELKAQLEA